MSGVDLAVIFFGLASAFSWGAGDFSGGLASKRSSAFSVVVISQLVSLLVLILIASLISEGTNTVKDLVIGGIAGVCGAAGLVALYAGLARGPMGIIAPVTGLIAALVPVLFSIFNEGFPALVKLLGFITAIFAVWIISRSNQETKLHLRDLGLPAFAGLGFGIFFILIDQVSANAILWPLLSARLSSVLMVLVLGLLTRNFMLPKFDQLPIIALAGIFDIGGNVFYALSTRVGRLDIAAVLGSLYPAVTVLLAWIILKEALTLEQWVGVILALGAIVLIGI
jgi:drug/metabolite transporter (DMT)-like permease